MARVIDGDPGAGPGRLVIRVSSTPEPVGNEAAAPCVARVRIQVADPALAARLETAITRSIEAARAAVPPLPTCRVVRVDAGSLEASEGLAGAIALVPVTRRSAHRLPGLVAALARQGVLGVQLVWDGRRPTRAVAEPFVFRALEARRARLIGCPVLLAPLDTPVEALLREIADLAQPGSGQGADSRSPSPG